MSGFNQHTSAQERFEASYIPEPMSGCWLWTGAVNRSRSDVRPIIQVSGARTLAYRLSYEIHNGAIPAGRLVCHRCNNSLCVNPAHLYAGTHADNARDAVQSGRHNAQIDPEAARERGRRLGLFRKRPRPGTLPSKIPLADLNRIRERIAAGERYADVAADYGVSAQAVHQRLSRARALQSAQPPAQSMGDKT